MRQTKLTIKQLDEIIDGRASEKTSLALVAWAKGERFRRVIAGRNGGRPRGVDTPRRKQLREAQARYKAKNVAEPIKTEVVNYDFGA